MTVFTKKLIIIFASLGFSLLILVGCQGPTYTISRQLDPTCTSVQATQLALHQTPVSEPGQSDNCDQHLINRALPVGGTPLVNITVDRDPSRNGPPNVCVGAFCPDGTGTPNGIGYIRMANNLDPGWIGYSIRTNFGDMLKGGGNSLTQSALDIILSNSRGKTVLAMYDPTLLQLHLFTYNWALYFLAALFIWVMTKAVWNQYLGRGFGDLPLRDLLIIFLLYAPIFSGLAVYPTTDGVQTPSYGLLPFLFSLPDLISGFFRIDIFEGNFWHTVGIIQFMHENLNSDRFIDQFFFALTGLINGVALLALGILLMATNLITKVYFIIVAVMVILFFFSVSRTWAAKWLRSLIFSSIALGLTSIYFSLVGILLVFVLPTGMDGHPITIDSMLPATLILMVSLILLCYIYSKFMWAGFNDEAYYKLQEQTSAVINPILDALYHSQAAPPTLAGVGGLVEQDRNQTLSQLRQAVGGQMSGSSFSSVADDLVQAGIKDAGSADQGSIEDASATESKSKRPPSVFSATVSSAFKPVRKVASTLELDNTPPLPTRNNPVVTRPVVSRSATKPDNSPVLTRSIAGSASTPVSEISLPGDSVPVNGETISNPTQAIEIVSPTSEVAVPRENRVITTIVPGTATPMNSLPLAAGTVSNSSARSGNNLDQLLAAISMVGTGIVNSSPTQGSVGQTSKLNESSQLVPESTSPNLRQNKALQTGIATTSNQDASNNPATESTFSKLVRVGNALHSGATTTEGTIVGSSRTMANLIAQPGTSTITGQAVPTTPGTISTLMQIGRTIKQARLENTSESTATDLTLPDKTPAPVTIVAPPVDPNIPTGRREQQWNAHKLLREEEKARMGTKIKVAPKLIAGITSGNPVMVLQAMSEIGTSNPIGDFYQAQRNPEKILQVERRQKLANKQLSQAENAKQNGDASTAQRAMQIARIIGPQLKG